MSIVSGQTSGEPSLRDYLAALWRRRFVILPFAIGIPLVAFVVAGQRPARYEATADVLVSQQNVAPSLTGAAVALPQEDADRFAVTQANLARTGPVAQATLQSVNSRLSVAAFLKSSSASASPDSDFIHLSVDASNPAVAVALAKAYAAEFAKYRSQLDTAALSRARADVAAKLAQLAKAGAEKSRLYTALLTQQQQLATLEIVQTPRAIVASSPVTATQVAPRPKRTALIAAALGLLLGLMSAFLIEAFDTRVRSADALVEELGLAVLGKLGAPPRRTREGLLSDFDPVAPSAEAFRMLRLNLDFALLDQPRSVLMVTSALPQEGKSTTVAHLGMAYAHADKNVLLVDLDLRQPRLHTILNRPTGKGLTHVALGRLSLPEAIVKADDHLSHAGARSNSRQGSLDVLPAGPLPPDPGAFVETAAVAALLAEARKRYDIVIVDTPPILDIADAIALAPHVDAVLLVAKLNEASLDQVRQLRRTLQSLPVPVVGFALTGVHLEVNRYYGEPPDRRGTFLESLPAPKEVTARQRRR